MSQLIIIIISFLTFSILAFAGTRYDLCVARFHIKFRHSACDLAWKYIRIYLYKSFFIIKYFLFVW